MKGPPWIPSTKADAICESTEGAGANTSCQTFSIHDALHLKQDLGYNFVRLGVTWAGGQPTPEPRLDADFEKRLQDFLALCHEHGIAVLLDLHQDAVGTANCGEGVPLWYSKMVTDVGRPLWPIPKQDDGSCGTNDTDTWAMYADDPDYNIKNPCCRRLNQGDWGKLGSTLRAQETVEHLLSEKGRRYYAQYTGLLAEAVRDYPAAIGIEIMNEPPTIDRRNLYLTAQACYDAIRNKSATLAVGVVDPGQTVLPIGNLGLARSSVQWLKTGSHLFYAFHWYGHPASIETTVSEALKLSGGWGMPSLLTEYGGYGDPGPRGGCTVQAAAQRKSVGSAYWHYSDYCWPKHCPGGLPDGHCPLPDGDRWGACITGWGNGNPNYKCPLNATNIAIV